jgi:signal transduction histidine kinase
MTATGNEPPDPQVLLGAMRDGDYALDPGSGSIEFVDRLGEMTGHGAGRLWATGPELRFDDEDGETFEAAIAAMIEAGDHRTVGSTPVVADCGEVPIAVTLPAVTVEADANRLQRLFQNLYRNAVEHGVRPLPSPSAGSRPRAT